MHKFNACWKVIFIFKLKGCSKLYELQVEYFYDQSEKSSLYVFHCLTRPHSQTCLIFRATSLTLLCL